MRLTVIKIICGLLSLFAGQMMAQVPAGGIKAEPQTYLNHWQVIATYPEGNDTLLYLEARHGKARLSGWDNSLAISNEQLSLIVDDQEQTLMLLPVSSMRRKAASPVELADSVWQFMDLRADSSLATVTDSMIIIEQAGAQIRISLNPAGGFVNEIKIIYKSTTPANDQEDLPDYTTWKLTSRNTDPTAVSRAVDIGKYLTKTGRQWSPTPAYRPYEFINLLNDNTD